MKSPRDGIDLGAESFDETEVSRAALETRLAALSERLRESDDDAPATAELKLQQAQVLLELGRNEAAWKTARSGFETLIAGERWAPAVRACEILFLCERPESLAALGQGVWLAVTFPVDPELTLALLQHIIDQTPDDSDGAAIAAATAAYVVDLRTEGAQHDELRFFAAQMLGSVARRHSGIEEQSEFDAWMKRLELYQPERFLVRLRNVIDVLVQDNWWFDVAQIHAKLPVN